VADISAQEFWTRTPEEREETFARLRAEEPVSWQRQPESDLLPQEEGSGGYWAVTRYDDVREASSNSCGTSSNMTPFAELKRSGARDASRTSSYRVTAQ
jgi:cytochrome P450